MPRIDRVHSDNFDYYYLKYLRDLNVQHFHQEAATRIVEQSIWFPPAAYSVLPIALPYAIRDKRCRSTRRLDGTDMWGCPTPAGYVRDDNSLIKGIIKNLEIASDPSSFGHIVYKGRRLGRGFVAAHIWPNTTHLSLSNSFWPNLVWLPKGLALLSDYEASFVQPLLQAVSIKIYGRVATCSHITVAKSWWILLSRSKKIPEYVDDIVRSISVDKLNYFAISRRFLRSRLAKIELVANALKCITENGRLPQDYAKVVTTKYTVELQQQSDPNCLIEPERADELRWYMRSYADDIKEALQNYG